MNPDVKPPPSKYNDVGSSSSEAGTPASSGDTSSGTVATSLPVGWGNSSVYVKPGHASGYEKQLHVDKEACGDYVENSSAEEHVKWANHRACVNAALAVARETARNQRDLRRASIADRRQTDDELNSASSRDLKGRKRTDDELDNDLDRTVKAAETNPKVAGEWMKVLGRGVDVLDDLSKIFD